MRRKVPGRVRDSTKMRTRLPPPLLQPGFPLQTGYQAPPKENPDLAQLLDQAARDARRVID